VAPSFSPYCYARLSNSPGPGDSFEGRPVKPGMSLDGLPTEARGRGQTKFAQRVLSGQKQPPAPTLFFGNLGFETTIESIRALLEAHRVKAKRNAAPSESTTNDDGANDPWIRKIRMGTFEDSGLCKGSVCLPSKKYHISRSLADSRMCAQVRVCRLC
jgi:hypothetical protein